jgi:phosphatidylethanolamine N-methyltransferase
LHTLLTTLTTSHLTRVTLASLLLQPAIYYLLSSFPTLRSAFFMFYFAFWRGAYDFGFGWMLRKQSERKWIVRTLRRWGWLQLGSTAAEPAGKYYTQPGWSAWWKRELEAKLGPDYSWDAVPQEFNAWIMFRQLVDVVLLK